MFRERSIQIKILFSLEGGGRGFADLNDLDDLKNVLRRRSKGTRLLVMDLNAAIVPVVGVAVVLERYRKRNKLNKVLISAEN